MQITFTIQILTSRNFLCISGTRSHVEYGLVAASCTKTTKHKNTNVHLLVVIRGWRRLRALDLRTEITMHSWKYWHAPMVNWGRGYLLEMFSTNGQQITGVGLWVTMHASPVWWVIGLRRISNTIHTQNKHFWRVRAVWLTITHNSNTCFCNSCVVQIAHTLQILMKQCIFHVI